jgi:hypothetical protein
MNQIADSTSTEVIDDIHHLDFSVTCDYVDCDWVATHRLICAKCKLFEFMCDPHTKSAKAAALGSWIVFDKSCKHRVDMFHCGKEPI